MTEAEKISSWVHKCLLIKIKEKWLCWLKYFQFLETIYVSIVKEDIFCCCVFKFPEFTCYHFRKKQTRKFQSKLSFYAFKFSDTVLLSRGHQTFFTVNWIAGKMTMTGCINICTKLDLEKKLHIRTRKISLISISS